MLTEVIVLICKAAAEVAVRDLAKIEAAYRRHCHSIVSLSCRQAYRQGPDGSKGGAASKPSKAFQQMIQRGIATAAAVLLAGQVREDVVSEIVLVIIAGVLVDCPASFCVLCSTVIAGEVAWLIVSSSVLQQGHHQSKAHYLGSFFGATRQYKQV